MILGEGNDGPASVDDAARLTDVSPWHDGIPVTADRLCDGRCRTACCDTFACPYNAGSMLTDMMAMQMLRTTFALDIGLPSVGFVVSTNRCGSMYLHRVMADEARASRLRACGQKRANDNAGMSVYTEACRHGNAQSIRAITRMRSIRSRIHSRRDSGCLSNCPRRRTS